MQHFAAVELLLSETARPGKPRPDRDTIIAALLSGGDSRTAIDPISGTSKYLCPPRPAPELTCFGSCTASPIGVRSFERAADALYSILGADTPALRAQRLADQSHTIEARLLAYFGIAHLAEAILCPSGTDALLTAAQVVAADYMGEPLTAILPGAAETGSGVRLAARCRQFDGDDAGAPTNGAEIDVVEVPLRYASGEPRAAEELNHDFDAAVAGARGRPVLYLTHGTKTGLIAPTTPPTGTDVIVDACQARITPAGVAAYIARGWPVVVTGSKFFGGPAFSGAVLLPHGRRAARPPASLGTVLRWNAALAVIDGFETQAPAMADFLRDRGAAVEQVLTSIPALVPVGGAPTCGPGWADMPSIFTFAVRDPRQPSRLLSAAELQPLYQRLARSGILLGQPVVLGSGGGLRVAIGARDLIDGADGQGLQRLFDALKRATSAASLGSKGLNRHR